MGIIASVIYWFAFAGGAMICIAALLSIKKKSLQACKNAFDAGVSREREACASTTLSARRHCGDECRLSPRTITALRHNSLT